MKKISLLCLIGLLLFSLPTSSGFGQDISDILEKMIGAQGGRKALEAIKDTTISGTMEITQMGLSGTITMYHKEPNKSRQDIEVMGMVITSAFDGETAWMINPQTGATEELPEDAAVEARRGALGLGNSILLAPEKFGVKYAFKGRETVDGKDCLVVLQTYADGHEATIYLDAQTYLTHKTKQMAMNQMGVVVDQEMIYSDFKKVDGVTFPFTVTIIQDGEEFGVMTTTEVKLNSGLEDSLFAMQ